MTNTPEPIDTDSVREASEDNQGRNTETHEYVAGDFGEQLIDPTLKLLKWEGQNDDGDQLYFSMAHVHKLIVRTEFGQVVEVGIRVGGSSEYTNDQDTIKRLLAQFKVF